MAARRMGLGVKRLLIVLSAVYWAFALIWALSVHVVPGFQKRAELDALFKGQGPALTATQFAELPPAEPNYFDRFDEPPAEGRFVLERPVFDGLVAAGVVLAFAGVFYLMIAACAAGASWVYNGFHQEREPQ